MRATQISRESSSDEILVGPGNVIDNVVRQRQAVDFVIKTLLVRRMGQDALAVFGPRYPSALVRRKLVKSLAVQFADQLIGVHRAPRWSPPPALFFSSVGKSATIASLVKGSVDTLAAFCSALRTTLVGSIIPSLTRSQYLPRRAAITKPSAVPGCRACHSLCRFSWPTFRRRRSRPSIP